ncbi:MAG: 4Fe-4S binding protein, partial [Gemmatimonadota bacterium]
MANATRELPVYHPTPPARGDLTRAPLLGRFLRWKHARTALQLPLLLLAGVIVADGLFGPQLSPQNTAGVAPWIQWRGLVVLALLLAGNLFCMACPFMLPRRLAKKLFAADRPWPSWLSGKWLALGTLVLFFWAYEALDLWASPWWTAWLVVSYFVAAFVLDAFFRGAVFCKHVCPIGSFNFANSLASPGEVRVRDVDVCASCETKDCIAGRREVDPRTGEERVVQSGCELWLFQPRKAGNMDCTFCLDCVQACPYDNVGILPRVPGAELKDDPWRSGIGRFSERLDVLVLVMAVVFLAFLNAAGMIRPMADAKAAIGRALGTGSEAVVWAAVMVVGLGVVPLVLLYATGALSRLLAGGDVPRRTATRRMAWGLVPLGFGMWLAHYAFHFLGSGLNLVPVLHRAGGDAGLLAGTPDWSLGAMIPPDWMLPLEMVVLEVGLLASLVLLHFIARSVYASRKRARRAFAPWAVLAVALGAAGAWIMTQPMEMRGMMPGMDMEGPGMEGGVEAEMG